MVTTHVNSHELSGDAPSSRGATARAAWSAAEAILFDRSRASLAGFVRRSATCLGGLSAERLRQFAPEVHDRGAGGNGDLELGVCDRIVQSDMLDKIEE